MIDHTAIAMIAVVYKILSRVYQRSRVEMGSPRDEPRRWRSGLIPRNHSENLAYQGRSVAPWTVTAYVAGYA